MGLPAIPTRHQDEPAHRQRIAEVVNGITTFQFDDSRVRTQAEITAGVTPVNYAYPPGDVRRWGAAETYDATVNDLPFLNAAIAALGPNGGIFTGPSRVYQIDGTLDITTLVTPMFGSCNNGSADKGFVLFSDTDAPILRFNTTANRFVAWSNFAVVGTSGAGLTAQHGIVINSAGVRFSNWNVRACGGDGVVVEQCYGGTFRDAYISLCDGDGVRWAGLAGANLWEVVNISECGGQGFNVDSADGSDHFNTCTSEKNGAAGWYFGANVEGFTGKHCYSELNGDGPVVWASSSNKNQLHFNSWSDSTGEPWPDNQGNAQNWWTGRRYQSDVVAPICIQRVYEQVFDRVTGSPNAIPYDDTIPQSNEGLDVTSITIVPKRAGNILKVKAWGWFTAAAGVGTSALFKNTDANAVYAQAHQMGSDAPVSFHFEWEDTSTEDGSNVPQSVTYSLKVGISVGGGVTFGGNTAGTRRYGGVALGGMSVEEFFPSSS